MKRLNKIAEDKVINHDELRKVKKQLNEGFELVNIDCEPMGDEPIAPPRVSWYSTHSGEDKDPNYEVLKQMINELQTALDRVQNFEYIGYTESWE